MAASASSSDASFSIITNHEPLKCIYINNLQHLNLVITNRNTVNISLRFLRSLSGYWIITRYFSSYGASKMLQLSVLMALLLAASAGNFYRDVDVTWGEGQGQIKEGGRVLTLSLDQYSGSGFQSKNEYLYGRFDVQLKLVPGNSAGTVTTFYLSSQGPGHDEIDFEFLGNVTGEPYTVHTNVYSQGKGNKEQQFHLWFDPTASFHTYSSIWNDKRIIFLVDNIAIRVYNHHHAIGIPFPTSQPMRVYCSLWNADDWATQGGRVKTDWTHAPFSVSYRNPNFSGKATSGSGSVLDSSEVEASQNRELDAKDRNRIRWVQNKHMIYNYCNDVNRFPEGISAECKRSRF